jgi:two-component system sensor histidine kinase DegS
MAEHATNSEDFVANVATILATIEKNLVALAQTALVEPDLSPSDQENGHASSQGSTAYLRRQKISQQLLRLSEQSKFLHQSLQNGLDLSLVNSELWPQIRILQSQEEERAQLAHELEDGVGQLLANAIFELASCRHLLANNQESVSVGLDALQEELEQGLADIRHFITDLEPTTVLSNFGLAGGLRRYLEQYQARTGLETQLHMRANIGRLPSIMENAIFRVIQEALNNTYRHANASQIDVVVEEIDGNLQFRVIDNGDGMVSEKLGVTKRNLGLARMIDYAELLNGTLRIFSEPGQGTQIILLVAYPPL